MNIEQILQNAHDNDVEMITFLYCDNGGIIRGKSTHISTLEYRIRSGIGLSVAMPAMTSNDTLQTVINMGPVGEIRLIPDINTFTILPYAPKWAVMMSNMYAHNRKKWGPCSRSYLQRMIKKATEMDLNIKSAFEPEWYLAIKNEVDNYIPCDRRPCFSTLGMMEPRKTIEEIIAALQKQGIQIQQYYPELGDGQQEISISYSDALTSADNQILYRETVRNIAWRNGYLASFAPKPFKDQAGSGCHIHLSIWDSGRNNIFFSRQSKCYLSDLALYFVSGVLNHLPGLMALTCPSVNSYRRLKPNSWSSSHICYGYDNREAAIRIPSTNWDDEMNSVNIEIKVPDSSANPYIALGGIIAAGLHGISEGKKPSEELLLDINPSIIPDDEKEHRGLMRLPTSLNESVEELSNDDILKNSMGPDLFTSYVAVRMGEIKSHENVSEDEECNLHFLRY